MKLFISYNTDDQAIVKELVRELRDEEGHEVWFAPQQLVGGLDWWDGICSGIENCDAVIACLSPRAVASIYCMGELDYALTLNKPVVPLLLKALDKYPERLERGRVQWIDAKALNLDQTLRRLNKDLGQIALRLVQGEFAPPQPRPARPPVPEPAPNEPEHAYEVFAAAEEAALQEDLALAEQLFNKVIKADPQGLGVTAIERLTVIRFNRERAVAYINVVRLSSNPATKDGAKALWRAYVAKYSTEHDPNGLVTLFGTPAAPQPQSSGGGGGNVSAGDVNSLLANIGGTINAQNIYINTTPNPITPSPSPTASRGRGEQDAPEFDIEALNAAVLKVLPPPFEWCYIPAGKVTLEEGGYVPKGGQTFDVPAFLMAKYPITNAQYERFIAAGGYQQEQRWTTAGWKFREENNKNIPRGWSEIKSDQGDHPVVNVSWYECLAFCQWLDEQTRAGVGIASRDKARITLPTEQQWQRAAQGDDGREYPWGNQKPDRSYANFEKNVEGTTPVTAYPDGISPYGVMDLSGNVCEWCSTAYESGEIGGKARQLYVLRGGSWDDSIDALRVATRDAVYPEWVLSNGFRCVSSVF